MKPHWTKIPLQSVSDLPDSKPWQKCIWRAWIFISNSKYSSTLQMHIRYDNYFSRSIKNEHSGVCWFLIIDGWQRGALYCDVTMKIRFDTLLLKITMQNTFFTYQKRQWEKHLSLWHHNSPLLLLPCNLNCPLPHSVIWYKLASNMFKMHEIEILMSPYNIYLYLLSLCKECFWSLFFIPSQTRENLCCRAT